MGRASRYDELARKVTLEVIEGVAGGSRQWAETHVSGGSSGIAYHVGGGAVVGNETEVRSRVVERQKFFVVAPDGREASVDTTGLDFPVRDGQRLKACFARVDDAGPSHLLLLDNLATGRTAEFSRGFNAMAQRVAGRGWNWVWLPVLGGAALLSGGEITGFILSALLLLGLAVLALLPRFVGFKAALKRQARAFMNEA